MSSKIFQPVLNRLKQNVSECMGVVDDRGIVIASTDLSAINTRINDFDKDMLGDESYVFQRNGMSYCALRHEGRRIEYASYCVGVDSNARMICSLVSVALNEAKSNYDEKHNRSAFVKNIISDNILPGDVYVRAKELHFTTDIPRCVILARNRGVPDMAATELVSRMFPDRQQDFVLNMNESDIVLVKTLNDADDKKEAYTYAKSIQDALRDELGITTVVGISTVAGHLRELADRYKESSVAIDIGAIFDSEKTIVFYDALGLGRIIYQLPTTLCEMFLNEVFKRKSIDTLDRDTLDTIDSFFENNLNVSETSRKLYVHRNTLVYRLEKIKKLTGLDLREFDHAIVFKVAMMVKQYLDSIKR